MKWPPETFLARLIRGLLDEGIHVTVATDQKPGREWQDRAGFHGLYGPHWKGAKARRLWRLAKQGGGALVRDRTSTLSLISEVNEDESTGGRLQQLNRLFPFIGRTWDLIYFPWNAAAITYLPLFEWGAPVVISCRGSQVNIAPNNPRRVQIVEGLAETLQRAAAVHCVSEDIRREAESYGLQQEKAWVIRPAVDPDVFFPDPSFQAVDSSTFSLVSTGSLIWPKGYEYALRAVYDLVANGIDVQYVIMGSGRDRQRLLYTIHDLGLEGHVRLLGRVPPEDVRDRLQQADAFLLPSVSEGISNAVLEAMACGLPVVTTDCGGMREAVNDGEEGFVVPVRDAEAMADALNRLAASATLRQKMGKAGRARILKDFRLDDQVQQFKEMVRACVAEGALQHA